MSSKNIVIIGDSWGIIPTGLTNCSTLNNHVYGTFKASDENVYDWLDYKLMQQGHRVYNRSWGGSDNFYQLSIAENLLDASVKNNFQIDLVIWFHSELLKEVCWNTDCLRNPTGHLKIIKEKGLEKGLDELSKDLYSYTKSISQKHKNTKWAIIGAGAPIRQSNKNILDFSDFIIDNLREYITGNTIPECHSFYTLYPIPIYFDKLLLEHNIMTQTEIDEEIIKCKIIEEVGKDITLFHNTRHPGPKAYKKLTSEIISYIETKL